MIHHLLCRPTIHNFGCLVLLITREKYFKQKYWILENNIYLCTRKMRRTYSLLIL